MLLTITQNKHLYNVIMILTIYKNILALVIVVTTSQVGLQMPGNISRGYVGDEICFHLFAKTDEPWNASDTAPTLNDSATGGRKAGTVPLNDTASLVELAAARTTVSGGERRQETAWRDAVSSLGGDGNDRVDQRLVTTIQQYRLMDSGVLNETSTTDADTTATREIEQESFRVTSWADLFNTLSTEGEDSVLQVSFENDRTLAGPKVNGVSNVSSIPDADIPVGPKTEIISWQETSRVTSRDGDSSNTTSSIGGEDSSVVRVSSESDRDLSPLRSKLDRNSTTFTTLLMAFMIFLRLVIQNKVFRRNKQSAGAPQIEFVDFGRVDTATTQALSALGSKYPVALQFWIERHPYFLESIIYQNKAKLLLDALNVLESLEWGPLLEDVHFLDFVKLAPISMRHPEVLKFWFERHPYFVKTVVCQGKASLILDAVHVLDLVEWVPLFEDVHFLDFVKLAPIAKRHPKVLHFWFYHDPYFLNLMFVDNKLDLLDDACHLLEQLQQDSLAMTVTLVEFLKLEETTIELVNAITSRYPAVVQSWLQDEYAFVDAVFANDTAKLELCLKVLQLPDSGFLWKETVAPIPFCVLVSERVLASCLLTATDPRDILTILAQQRYMGKHAFNYSLNKHVFQDGARPTKEELEDHARREWVSDVELRTNAWDFEAEARASLGMVEELSLFCWPPGMLEVTPELLASNSQAKRLCTWTPETKTIEESRSLEEAEHIDLVDHDERRRVRFSHSESNVAVYVADSPAFRVLENHLPQSSAEKKSILRDPKYLPVKLRANAWDFEAEARASPGMVEDLAIFCWPPGMLEVTPELLASNSQVKRLCTWTSETKMIEESRSLEETEHIDLVDHDERRRVRFSHSESNVAVYVADSPAFRVLENHLPKSSAEKKSILRVPKYLPVKIGFNNDDATAAGILASIKLVNPTKFANWLKHDNTFIDMVVQSDCEGLRGRFRQLLVEQEILASISRHASDDDELDDDELEDEESPLTVGDLGLLDADGDKLKSQTDEKAVLVLSTALGHLRADYSEVLTLWMLDLGFQNATVREVQFSLHLLQMRGPEGCNEAKLG